MKDKFSKPILYLVCIVVVAAAIEFVAYISVEYVLLSMEPSLFFRQPSITETAFQQYLANRDPLLGWPAKRKREDSAGGIIPRKTPSFQTAGSECISTYGDSFTYGDEVGDTEAWANVLSEALGCRVANFGVGGYGTDQAYLRYNANPADRARVVMLGIFPDNVMRNVNRYRYFLDGQTVFSLKPRFILDGEHLKLVGIPEWEFRDFVRATEYPATSFPYEAFVPDSENGPVSPKFPYSWRVLKLFLSERVRSGLLGKTSWEMFYERDHSAQALEITVRITDLFYRTSRSREQELLVIIYPTGRSFKEFKKTGRIAITPLVVELERRGIRFVDLHEAFGHRVGSEQFCNLLTQPTGCVGHFNAEGNRMIAEILYDHVTISERFNIFRKDQED